MIKQNYGDLIKSFQKMGYQTVSADIISPEKPHLLLRHDVDIELKYALEIAKIEKACNVHSTFFVLVTSDFYNALSEVSFLYMKEILDCGHQIGIHVDIGSVERFADIEKKVIKEAQILSSFLSTDINTFSFHRPSSLERFRDYHQIEIDGFTNYYEPRLFESISYVSDSRGGWFHGHPLEKEEVKQRRALHLLTHPIWWSSLAVDCETANDVLHKYAKFCDKNSLRLFKEQFRIF